MNSKLKVSDEDKADAIAYIRRWSDEAGFDCENILKALGLT